MFNLQSGLMPAASLSERSRSTSASRSAISAGVVGLGRIHPFLTQSLKVTRRSDHVLKRALYELREEMTSRSQAGSKFLARIHRRVDLPPDALLRRGKRGDNFPEGDTAHDKKVHVALCPKRAAGAGSEDDRGVDALREPYKRFSELIGQARRLQGDALELGEYRTACVGLVEDLVSANRSTDDSAGGKLLELPRD